MVLKNNEHFNFILLKIENDIYNTNKLYKKDIQINKWYTILANHWGKVIAYNYNNMIHNYKTVYLKLYAVIMHIRCSSAQRLMDIPLVAMKFRVCI